MNNIDVKILLLECSIRMFTIQNTLKCLQCKNTVAQNFTYYALILSIILVLCANTNNNNVKILLLECSIRAFTIREYRRREKFAGLNIRGFNATEVFWNTFMLS